MRLHEDGRGQEYLDEDVCLHEDLYVNDITVKIKSRPYGDRPDLITNDGWLNWQKYLANNGTELFELYADVVCEKCGATQEQYIDIDTILETKTWEWEE